MISKPFERIVFIHLPGESEPRPAGMFILDPDLGVGRFQYGRKYLERPNAMALDPVNLPLTGEEYLTRKNKGIFGVLGDVLPDSWGRFILAKQHNVPFGTLKDFELIDMASTQTVGALSFGENPEQPTTREEQAVSLDDLGEVATAFDRALNDDVPSEIRYLLQQGTSLGGAQPKCPVTVDGEDWIAKFESSKTLVKYPAIEFATMTLARQAGISIPDIQVETVSGRKVYLIKRFDRIDESRLPFLSALALSNLDIDELEQGSYPALADLMRKFVENVVEDHHEMFRRMAFNMFVRNEDDHLRNHGFIYQNGWSLSPAYDVVPMPARQRSAESFHLSLQAGEFGSEATLANLLSGHGHFSLTEKDAENIIREVADSLQNWEGVLEKSGVSASDLESVRWCFEGFRNNQFVKNKK